mmetsp:Transcript_41775/g.110080  ORF Transcript_41775/g.110080 Transcript_41775/m.110080 type:complete len:209 (+) Transcript_41775:4003-4629(+)
MFHLTQCLFHFCTSFLGCCSPRVQEQSSSLLELRQQRQLPRFQVRLELMQSQWHLLEQQRYKQRHRPAEVLASLCFSLRRKILTRHCQLRNLIIRSTPCSCDSSLFHFQMCMLLIQCHHREKDGCQRPVALETLAEGVPDSATQRRRGLQRLTNPSISPEIQLQLHQRLQWRQLPSTSIHGVSEPAHQLGHLPVTHGRRQPRKIGQGH